MKLPITGTASPDSVRAMTLELLLKFLGEKTPAEVEKAGLLEAIPDTSALEKLLGLLDTFDLWFNIIEP